MAVRRYEISLRVLKNISRMSAIYYLFYNSNGDLFTCEDKHIIFTCYNIMFSRESSPRISLAGVYVMECILRLTITKGRSHIIKADLPFLSDLDFGQTVICDVSNARPLEWQTS